MVLPSTLSLGRPDDFHLHLRDGAALGAVIGDTALRFARALVMPNLKPPVNTAAAALAYRARIEADCPPGLDFQPLMSLYLTDATPPAEVDRAREAGIPAFKWYPAGATTHAEAGVTDVARVEHVLARMAERGVLLLVHGEATDPEVDVFDREAVFVERVLAPLVERHPGLRVVLEHVTTSEGVDFVRGARDGVAATITAHHLLIDRNALFAGGLRPHHYCLPVPKRARHREALLAAATSGSPRFFLGTDSAPHGRRAKEAACGCAGIYTAHAALELYAEAFEEVHALDRLEGFASRHGAAFYGLPPNGGRVTLRRETWGVPDELPFGNDRLIPFRAGGECRWRLVA